MRDTIVNEIQIDHHAETITAVENLAKAAMHSLDQLKEERKKKKEELESVMLGHEEFEKVIEKEAKMKEEKRKAKAMVMQSPVVHKLSDELDHINGEIKEKKLSLSGYLADYVEHTRQLTIEDYLGNLQKIEMNPKLRKETKPWNPNQKR
jgi:hypothetical protein